MRAVCFSIGDGKAPRRLASAGALRNEKDFSDMAFVTDEDIPYTSSAVEDIAYDAAKRELFAAFHNQPIEWFTLDDGD